MSKTLADILRSYIPDGDGYNSEYAHNLNAAADALESQQIAPAGYVMVPATIGGTEYRYREALKQLREVLDPEDWMGEISMHAFIDAALSAPSHGEQVREGWKLVPVEPTPEMLDCIMDWQKIGNVTAYRAMLAASPKAEPEEEECFCDKTNLGVKGVTCGDCPRDYKPKAEQPPVQEPVAWSVSGCYCQAFMIN